MATSRPPFMRARCTCPMEAAAKGRSSKYSSLSLQWGPRSLLRVFCKGAGKTGVQPGYLGYPDTHQLAPQFAPRCPGLSPSPASLTVICFSGMKSALCRTRSKILAR